MEVNEKGERSNEVTTVDAGTATCWHIERHWPGASEWC